MRHRPKSRAEARRLRDDAALRRAVRSLRRPSVVARLSAALSLGGVR